MRKKVPTFWIDRVSVKIIRIFYNLLSEPTYLHTNNNKPTVDTRNLFSSIAKYCPYLETVDTCHNPEPLWRLLQQESSCWKYLKEIPKILSLEIQGKAFSKKHVN
ncbi:hypothetical protein EDC94DRAFT_581220 [Helicostylum pulchrum]|nr:hypothetical protein EDC94DRAFT_581220 [Helicostylum pulchrum]